MSIQPFQLERYFAEYEFKVKYLLSSSDCESLPMAEVVQMASPESRALWEDLKLGYTESQGHPLLREGVSRMYRHVPAENILIAAPEELIYIAMQTMLRPGDHIVAVSPSYQSLHEVARSLGCQVTPWTVKAGPDGWLFDLSELERSIRPNTRMLVINFPHNPTGYLPTIEYLISIVDLARRNDLYLFSDEMYRLLELDPAVRLPPVADLYEKAISLSGLSKTFSLPGLRLGWLATQDHALLDRWQVYHEYTTICNSAPSEILGLIALQNQEAIIRRNVAIVSHNIAAADRFFSSHADLFHWFQPKAGSVAFPQWCGEGTVEQFCQAVLNTEGVMIVPGYLFGFEGSHFRIGLGRRNFPEALEHVGMFLAAG